MIMNMLSQSRGKVQWRYCILRIYPRSETEWFYRVVEATLTFKVNKNGQCSELELFQNGARRAAKRIE